MERRALELAQENNDRVTAYIGLGSSAETHKRVIEEGAEKENGGQKKKQEKLEIGWR